MDDRADRVMNGATPAVRGLAALLCCLALLFTQACMLVSGDRVSSDAQPAGGNVTRTFIGAEGDEEYELLVGAGAASLQVIVIVEAQQGEAIVEVLQPGGSVALSVRSRPGEQISRSGTVLVDDTGTLRYRVFARGARDGGYQILYQRVLDSER